MIKDILNSKMNIQKIKELIKNKLSIKKLKDIINTKEVKSTVKLCIDYTTNNIIPIVVYPILLLIGFYMLTALKPENSNSQLLVIDETENITTSSREYDLLINNAINYRDKIETSGVVVDTNTINENLIYVDNIESLDTSENNNIEQLEENDIEYTHYYFNDMVITNYIENNELKSNVVKFKDTSGIETSLTSLDNIVTIDNGDMISIDIIEKIQEGLENKEETQLSDIDNITIRLATDINDVLKGVKESNNLISASSKKSIKESKSTKVNYIKLGKESIEDKDYNIAFVQLINTENDDIIMLNLICKLDSNYKINDIITL